MRSSSGLQAVIVLLVNESSLPLGVAAAFRPRSPMCANLWALAQARRMLPHMHLAPQEIRTYFTTFSTANRRRLFQVEDTARLMISTLQGYRETGSFALHAFVVMPDHVHVLLTPAPEVSLEKAIQLMKGGFSFRLKSQSDTWERGHFDRRIKDRSGYEACVGYIHANPVDAGIVVRAEEYPFSSAHSSAIVDPMPGWFEQAQG